MKINTNIEVGKMGEWIGYKYLKTKGYRIIKRNQKEGFDEIDIIGISKGGLLVFFEVKTFLVRNIKSDHYNLKPEDNLTKEKFRRIKRVCEMFSAKHTKRIFKDVGWRIDLLAIKVSFVEGLISVKHFKNISR